MENNHVTKDREPVVIRFRSKMKTDKNQSKVHIYKKLFQKIVQEEGLPLLISSIFILFMVVWLSFLLGPSHWGKLLNKKIFNIKENQVIQQPSPKVIQKDLPPGITINTHASYNKTIKQVRPEMSKPDQFWLIFHSIYKTSLGLSYYFYYKQGLFSVILSVIGLIIITVLIAYFRYKNYQKSYLLLDCIALRWIDLLPQFFLLLVSNHIILLYLKPEDAIIPFIWSFIICWTMGPYFFRQLFPYVTSFFRNRVYDAELIVGEKRSVIWIKYLINQHCLSIIMVLICYILGNLILTESCMAYLVSFTNQGEFPSLGGILAFAFLQTEQHGFTGIQKIYQNISLTGIMSLACIFSAVVCFNALGRCIIIVQDIRKQMVYEK